MATTVRGILIVVFIIWARSKLRCSGLICCALQYKLNYLNQWKVQNVVFLTHLLLHCDSHKWKMYHEMNRVIKVHLNSNFIFLLIVPSNLISLSEQKGVFITLWQHRLLHVVEAFLGVHMKSLISLLLFWVFLWLRHKRLGTCIVHFSNLRKWNLKLTGLLLLKGFTENLYFNDFIITMKH